MVQVTAIAGACSITYACWPLEGPAHTTQTISQILYPSMMLPHLILTGPRALVRLELGLNFNAKSCQRRASSRPKP